jgi:hypothetical protein
MDPLVPACEQEFYRVFEGYFDLEVRTNLRYGSDVYSLDRMMPVAEAAGNPERLLRVVHVAGTKGKGSTSFLDPGRGAQLRRVQQSTPRLDP